MIIYCLRGASKGVGGGGGGGGGSVVTENPKGGITENFGRIQRGPLKSAWTMKTWRGGGGGGGGDRESHQMLLGGNIQRGIG